VEHFGPGHTDGDVFIYFEKADVMAFGDYLFIDNERGGGVNLAIAWANTGIERTTEKNNPPSWSWAPSWLSIKC
jgi:hypothetical protein